MFFGRTDELKKLDDMYGSGKFEFAVIYGRRRVGKTALIREFIKDKNAMFFTANESTAGDNLLSLSRIIGGKSSAPVYHDYEDALSIIFDMADDSRFVFVIDEFPYLAGSYRGISSLLQILIDRRHESFKLMLILCGSSMSFMENQVLGYKSPLYGRRTAQFKLLPFSFFESLPFFPDYAPENQAVLYGVTGGIPEYLTKIDLEKTVEENITDLFLTPSGHFFEEPSNLIKQELREPATYNVIIESIAHGASRLNEIATKSGLESNKCAKYLSSLIALGLVRKEFPFGEPVTKRSIYRLEDQMFRFWYRFVFPNTSAIVAGLGNAVFEHEVAEQLSDYMGLIFKDICKQWLFEQGKRDALPLFAGDIGRWWGTNPKTKTQEEIDLMSIHKDDALFGECKWRNSEPDMKVYEELKRKSDLFHYKNKFLYIFSKVMFPKNLLRLKEVDDSVKLLTLKEMIDMAR